MAEYISYKGVKAPLVALGLKGYYITVAVTIVLISFIGAVSLGSTTFPILLSISIPFFLGWGLLHLTAYLNGKYGMDGIMKLQVSSRFPEYMKRRLRIHHLLKRKNQ